MVGAGIGGSATAHFLRQHFGPEVQVNVYDKGEVGGRLSTVSVNHNEYETGGSIIHSLNLHMQDFVKQLGECTRLQHSTYTQQLNQVENSVFNLFYCRVLNPRFEVPTQCGRQNGSV